jgi:hypothetical protein
MPMSVRDNVAHAPVMCAFFLLADCHALSVDDLGRPAVALALAAQARRLLDPWTGYAANARREVLTLADRIRPLAEATLASPDCRWWRQPLGSSRQMWSGSSHDGKLRVNSPTAVTPFESYAQRPARWFATATNFDGTSALHALLADQVGDWDPVFPVPQAYLDVPPTVRAFEVDSPEDWRALVERYRVPPLPPEDAGLGAAGLVVGATPDWTMAVRDLDAVHLTFHGFLTTTYVTTGAADDRMTLWAWDCEQTLWLRDPPGTWSALAPLTRRPSPALGPATLPLRAAEEVGSPSSGWLRRAERRR